MRGGGRRRMFSLDAPPDPVEGGHFFGAARQVCMKITDQPSLRGHVVRCCQGAIDLIIDRRWREVLIVWLHTVGFPQWLVYVMRSWLSVRKSILRTASSRLPKASAISGQR